MPTLHTNIQSLPQYSILGTTGKSNLSVLTPWFNLYKTCELQNKTEKQNFWWLGALCTSWELAFSGVAWALVHQEFSVLRIGVAGACAAGICSRCGDLCVF